ncbi:MAG TPA: ATPase, T2SS/T4P/T4SS family, partial [Syntrophales bacterium]|nr:ATPase, T2SS/T4P/T4SS family [Syntrophales bacterium]
MRKFTAVIAAAVREGFSDVHIAGGHPIVFRKNGRIQSEESVRWTPQEIDALVRKLLTPAQLRELAREWSTDLSLSVHGVRLRLNVFSTTRGLSLAIRLLPGVIPTIEKLNLHPSLQQIADLKAGLVLFCGATGTGKSTTIAAVIDEINRSRAAHIVTLEDPIEYRFLSKKSFIEQRELGTHVPTFEKGLLDVLREDPDVIVVGELREPEVMRLTLNAAESGHLVIASLHATNAEDAIYRLCNS